MKVIEKRLGTYAKRRVPFGTPPFNQYLFAERSITFQWCNREAMRYISRFVETPLQDDASLALEMLCSPR
jgi:hypothetical protein